MNYSETLFDYDVLERRNRVAVSGSACTPPRSSTVYTITRTVWTAPQRVASTWVGTNDTGATDASPAGPAPVQFVQSKSQDSSGTSVTVTPTTDVTAGNTLVAYGCIYNATPTSTAITDTMGNTWTLVQLQAGASADAGGAGMWIASVSSSGSINVTLTAGSARCALAVMEYSGVLLGQSG